ncbi:hypothetical protein [Flagellimonas halotolerans]|uniref:MORN repeat variant n=1 Tax=Flagellimonas halotolerans TaxID=3112164 RepID=A0ABU6IN69_9FLAO|nr:MULTISPECIES: hypothetical protein [unclassified Allomuricauda]MEC3964612.1 hypothetical protein [Muricauda sp. SYSU M86414]MEC4264481.1 hypothetical protein [Muricauda sp. SYSU M84420]
MARIIVILLSLISLTAYAQDSLDIKSVYLENNIAYRIKNGNPYSGTLVKKRKNGHIVYTENYSKGIILTKNLYFNTKTRKLANRTIYNKNRPFVPKKEFVLNLSSDTIEIKYFTEKGSKDFVEQFEQGQLIYSCEYNGKKKHGLETCHNEDGTKQIFEYNMGKKIKNKVE